MYFKKAWGDQAAKNRLTDEEFARLTNPRRKDMYLYVANEDLVYDELENTHEDMGLALEIQNQLDEQQEQMTTSQGGKAWLPDEPT